MIALVDSDVLLDLGFPREPFAEEAAQLLEWCRQHTGRGFLAWHSLANVHYLLRVTTTTPSPAGFWPAC